MSYLESANADIKKRGRSVLSSSTSLPYSGMNTNTVFVLLALLISGAKSYPDYGAGLGGPLAASEPV